MDARIKSGPDEENKNCGHPFPSGRSLLGFSRYFLL